jgi:hypothetical protein
LNRNQALTFWREQKTDKKLTSTICWSNFDHDHCCDRLHRICILVPLLDIYFLCGKQVVLHICFTCMSIVAKISCGLGAQLPTTRKKLYGGVVCRGTKAKLPSDCHDGRAEINGGD